MDVVEILTLSFLLTLTVHVHSGISHLGRFPNARSGFAGVEMNKRNLSHRPYQQGFTLRLFSHDLPFSFSMLPWRPPPGPHRQIKFLLVCATSLFSRVLGVDLVFHVRHPSLRMRNYLLTSTPLQVLFFDRRWLSTPVLSLLLPPSIIRSDNSQYPLHRDWHRLKR